MRHRVQQMPRALKEQIRLSRFRAQEAQVEFLALFLTALLAVTQRHFQPERSGLFRRFVQQEKRHVLDRQSVYQPVRHRSQHLVQIGFRAQFACEFDQRAPVIIAVFVEEIAVQLFL